MLEAYRTEECVLTCPDEYKPICGYSIKVGRKETFDNVCVFNVFACINDLEGYNCIIIFKLTKLKLKLFQKIINRKK